MLIDFEKIYSIKDANYEKAEEISKALNISLLTAKVLLNRGFTNEQQCIEFLDTELTSLLDPFLLNDMDKATDKIIEKIKAGEKICIYGDYDADGVTSITVLKIFFDEIGANSFYYIPNRLEEGYGLNKGAVDRIHKEDASLVITVDCGISSFDEVDYFNEKGIEVIITDHHQCGDELPKAFSVINPSRKDSTYPFKYLAGVGVAFKLVQALSIKMGIPLAEKDILPFVTIGTVSDIVPLVGENRVIVKNGLKSIKDSNNIGLQALLKVSGLANQDIYSYHVGFVLGPRLNASGRLGLAKNGVELFLTKDEDKAIILAENLDKENIKRQDIESEILKDVEKQIKEKIDLDRERVIVLASEDWHSGVIGIVASRIVEKHHRPTILFAIEDGEARGSARSISTFNIYEGLKKCSSCFIGFGGHKQAAGIHIKAELIDEFREKINKVANEDLDEYELIPEITIDCEIGIEDINLQTARELKSLEPFGIGNPSPQFIFKNGTIKDIRGIGKEKKHLKLLLNRENKDVDAVGFNFGNYANILKHNDKIDLIGTLNINEYMGKSTPQLLIKDINNKKDSLLGNNYYIHMKNLFKTREKIEETGLMLEELSELNDYLRLEYVIEALKEKNNLLLLVFNYYNAEEILRLIQMTGRDILGRTNISFNKTIEGKTNNLVILPVLDKIDFDQFENIILYDANFHNFGLKEFLDKNLEKVEVLASKKDYELNKKLLNYITPTVEEMRLFYKLFFSSGEEIFKLDSKLYLNSINNNFNINVSEAKLNLILEIFKECNLLDFVKKDGAYFIKLLSKPNDKFNILKQPTLEYLYSLKELQ
ncbi:MAG TPA: single-stranded-DNA-specific exonuclease RecJ [Tissierellales bacterium]|nr:single-stranded-DNA-specific exonuclease RecJ [Tissierellales bacterium]